MTDLFASPTSAKFILELSVLAPGDILFTSALSVSSKTIRKVTDGQYSHVLLYVGGGSAIHADGDGVHSVNMQRELFDVHRDVTVLRMKVDAPRVVQDAINFVRSQVGTEYSKIEAVRSVVARSTSDTAKQSRQFCSRLVAQAYAHGGLNLVKNFDYCFPEDIRSSELLKEVDGFLKTATAADIAFAETENPIQRQTSATNYLLNEARRLFGHRVQALHDIDLALIDSPEHDAQMTRVLKESGYLDLWRTDLLKNPWRYEIAEARARPISPDQAKSLAEEELKNGTQQLSQFRNMREQYFAMYRHKPLKYFSEVLSLYENLVRIHSQRVMVATQFLTP